MTCQFKKKDYKNFLKDISAFANTSGGSIIWGIDDKTREVVGVKNTTSKLEIITDAINDKIQPCPPYKIDVVKYNDKKLIVVEIEVGKNPPYFLWTKANKEAYLRRGLSSIPGETYELKELILESLNKKWDTRVSEVKLEDVTFNDLKNEYKNKLGKALTEDKFEALGLIDNNGMLTNTGVVFSDQGLFHSQVFCTRWLGLTMSEATDSKNFSGSLIKLLEQAETFVKNNTKSGWRIGNQSFSRINKYEYDSIQ